jgi:hypothetical protein
MQATTVQILKYRYSGTLHRSPTLRMRLQHCSPFKYKKIHANNSNALLLNRREYMHIRTAAATYEKYPKTRNALLLNCRELLYSTSG